MNIKLSKPGPLCVDSEWGTGQKANSSFSEDNGISLLQVLTQLHSTCVEFCFPLIH